MTIRYDGEVRRRMAIMEAYLEGAPIEIKGLDHDPNKWFPLSGTQFDNWADYDYRVKPDEEIAAEPDIIDWAQVSDKYKYMARDSSGDAYLYLYEPELVNNCYWFCEDDNPVKADVFASYKKGDVSWDNSLVERP